MATRAMKSRKRDLTDFFGHERENYAFGVTLEPRQMTTGGAPTCRRRCLSTLQYIQVARRPPKSAHGHDDKCNLPEWQSMHGNNGPTTMNQDLQ